MRQQHRSVDSVFPNSKRYGGQTKKAGGIKHPAGKRTGVQGVCETPGWGR